MKKETFEKAQTLNQKIEDINNALDRIDRNVNDCQGRPINISFLYDEDEVALKQAVTNYLKSRKAKLQKEFDLLK